MSEEDRADFLAQLRWSALEEAALAEIPLGVTDHVRGTKIKHGPWLPEDCAEVLMRWLDRGLVEVFRLTSEFKPEDMNAGEARRVLSRPELWPDDWRVRLSASDAGLHVDPIHWI